MTAKTMITPGFSDPVFQSQAAFRALLAALSEPGTLQQVASEITPPEGLATATATALLTLADYETPVWLPEALRNGPAGAWLRFHCAAALVDRRRGPHRLAFRVILLSASHLPEPPASSPSHHPVRCARSTQKAPP